MRKLIALGNPQCIQKNARSGNAGILLPGFLAVFSTRLFLRDSSIPSNPPPKRGQGSLELSNENCSLFFWRLKEFFQVHAGFN